MNCALCSDVKGGVLPCNKAKAKADDGRRRRRRGPEKNAVESCPDDKIMKTRRYYMVKSTGLGVCQSLSSATAVAGAAKNTLDKFPIIGKESKVLTKAWVTHPHMASKPVGVVMFKRLVSHTCTGKGKRGFCQKGATVFDVHKVGYCVKCDKNVFDSSAAKTEDKERESFVEKCLPKAITAKGKIHPKFRCGEEDKELASAAISAF